MTDVEGLMMEHFKKFAKCKGFRELANLHAEVLEELREVDMELVQQLSPMYTGVVLSRTLTLLADKYGEEKS